MGENRTDIFYMQRCVHLAKKGIRNTHTNPMVGCVIVYDHRILAEGYHQQFGGHHAEVNALNSINAADRKFLPQATMYVSLEPCAHVGKTPSCAHRIVVEGIKKVVIGCTDPNILVAGKGIKYLQEHGVYVRTPILEEECIQLIAKFKANLSGLPFIILKWAQSADHFISGHNTQTWLSNGYTQVLNHKWRSETEGIMIGKNTANVDNPTLNVREYSGPSPMRILMDTNLSSQKYLKILTDNQPTLIVNRIKEGVENQLTYIKVADITDPFEVMSALFNFGISSVIVEGGATLLNHFIAHRCWHEARVICSDKVLIDGIRAPYVDGHLQNSYQLANDKILIIVNNNFKS